MTFPRIIYAIRVDGTGKIYIGSTSCFSSRIMGHVSRLQHGLHSNKAMQADFDKYGGDLTVFLLDTIASANDKNKEFLWMDALRTRDPAIGYNDVDQSVRASLELKPTYSVRAGKEFFEPVTKKLKSFAAEHLPWSFPRGNM